jgi:crotonobetainyl-CoA:carnitine CoA-transferase CaiB-like acyl-CoA transferase
VPSSPVNSVRDLFADPHLKARENIMSAAGPLGTLIRMAGIVPKLSLTPGGVDALGPQEPGAHNEEIYGGRLGLTRGELAGLRARGVI